MLFSKIKNRLKKLLREFDHYLEAHVEIALKITSGVKKALLSPVADIVAFIVPADLGNSLRSQLVNALNEALSILSVVDQCRQYADINEKLKCFIEHLKCLDPHLQDAILQKLASLLTGTLDGQRLKQSSYDLFTQAKYTASK